MGNRGPRSTRYVRKTRVPWSSRLGNAFQGILIGLLLVVAALVLLFWNEGRAVQTARSLAEAGAAVVSVDAAQVDPAREGELIHVSGPLQVTEPVRDEAFGVAATAARLVRTVEMYQWEEQRRTETRTRTGGAEERVTTYDYRPVWSDREIESARFQYAAQHRNPPKPFENREVVARDARLGAFDVGRNILTQLPASDEVRVEAQAAEALAEQFEAPVQVAGGRILVGEDPADPQIGDLRISYTAAPVGPISVVARQTAESLAPYQTAAGDAILLAEAGVVPADAMLRAAERENMLLSWGLRLLGTGLIFLGFAMVLRPIAVFGDVIPLLGSILRAGTGIVAAAATAILAPLVIALAWFTHRPIVAVIILITGLAVAFAIQRLLAGRVTPRQDMAQNTAPSSD